MHFLILLAIGVLTLIGWFDDIVGLPIFLRFVVHVMAGLLLVHYFNWKPLWGLAIVLSVIWMNAFNFMDGANGMLGLYGLSVVLVGLFLESQSGQILYISFSILTVIALLIFIWGNARKKALWIAGDTGSITLGYIVFFILYKAIQPATISDYTGMAVCGSIFLVDAGCTVLLRLLKGENVLQRHQMHLYQLLIGQAGFSPIFIALVFSFLQLGEFFILNTLSFNPVASVVILIFNIVLWLWVRFFIIKIYRAHKRSVQQ